MIFAEKTILITGACGGIGECLIYEFLLRNVKKIYAADLSKDRLDILQLKYGNIIHPIKLDVTKEDDIIACKEQCDDIDMLFNNAGIECATGFLHEKSIKASFLEMSVNYFGVHNLCLSFWQSLKSKESAAIVNILSIASIALILKLGTYCASKTAAHLLTQGLRFESNGSNIKVFAVYPGYVDTEMTKKIDVEKVSPKQIALQICNNIQKNILDIFPDETSKKLFRKKSTKEIIFSGFNK